MILTYREADDIVPQDNPHKNGTTAYTIRVQRDKQAKALIGLSLLDEMLEHVQGGTSARQMLKIFSTFSIFTRC